MKKAATRQVVNQRHPAIPNVAQVLQQRVVEMPEFCGNRPNV